MGARSDPSLKTSVHVCTSGEVTSSNIPPCDELQSIQTGAGGHRGDAVVRRSHD